MAGPHSGNPVQRLRCVHEKRRDGVGVDEWRGAPGIRAMGRAARLGWGGGFFCRFAGGGCSLVDLEPEPAAHP